MKMVISAILLLATVIVPLCIGRNVTNLDFQFFTNRTRQCTSTFGPKTLLHIPTSEGLLSHINQLEVLWGLSRRINLNKKIIEVPFRSHHFPGEIVTVCDILQFPSDLVCSCETSELIGSRQKHCPMLGFNVNWATHANSYGMNDSQTEIAKDVDLFKETCIAGMLNSLQRMSRYKKNFDKPPARFPIKFNRDYVKLAEIVL